MLAALLMLSACGDDEGDVVVGPGTNPSGGTAVVNNNKNINSYENKETNYPLRMRPRSGSMRW